MPDDLRVKLPEPTADAGPDPSSISGGNNGNAAEAMPHEAVKPHVNHIPPEECRECLAAMTHRLVQPLTALRGGLELGLLGKPSELDYRALLQQSLELTDALTQMVVSLRNLGESGVSSGPLQCVSLNAFVQQSMAEVAAWAQSRNVSLQLMAEEAVKISANPERLSEALQALFAWVIQNASWQNTPGQNSAGGATLSIFLSTFGEQAHLLLSPPKTDGHYLQVKMLEDITIPGVLFSYASKAGTLGWAINQRLVEGLGGKLEILTAEGEAGRIRVRFPLAPQG